MRYQKSPTVRYRKITTRMWGDDRFRALSVPPPNGQTLWVYLLTGPHTHAIPGLFAAGEAALAEALNWPLRGFRHAFQEIGLQGMAIADWTARVVWIPKAVVHNPPESTNVIRAWRAGFDEVPECPLRHQALQQLQAFVEGMGEGFRQAFREAFAQALAEPLAQGQGQSGTGAVTGTDTPPICPPRGGPLSLTTTTPGFNRFWEHYPKRVGKDKALKVWRQKKCEPIAADVLAGLARTLPHITRDNGKFIPLPATWLAEGRWQDDPATLNGPRASHDWSRYQEGPLTQSPGSPATGRCPHNRVEPRVCPDCQGSA